jgi:beta-1,4-mannosyl-glycoprotein beta-1,4-N-acetylglucosaminyltransferase
MVDAFIFYKELDLLEIRLNALEPYVDKFVLCEAPISHTGKPKPLYFQDNADRFKDFNIVALVADLKPPETLTEVACMSVGNAQREFLMNGITDNDPEEIILFGDMDEIPDLRGYAGQEGVFKQILYYYYLNVYTGTWRWKGTIAYKKKNILSFGWLRRKRSQLPTIGGGWHFSYVGPTDYIIEKIGDAADPQWNTDENREKMEERRRNLVDPFNRSFGPPSYWVEMPSGPQWLLDNKDKYRHMFWPEETQ